MDVKIGPISSHSFEGILLVSIIWIGLVWVLVEFTNVPDIVLVFGSLGVLGWVIWVVFYLLATPAQDTPSSTWNEPATSNPPKVCPECQSRNSYQARYTTGGGWRISHYVCTKCGHRKSHYR